MVLLENSKENWQNTKLTLFRSLQKYSFVFICKKRKKTEEKKNFLKKGPKLQIYSDKMNFIFYFTYNVRISEEFVHKYKNVNF